MSSLSDKAQRLNDTFPSFGLFVLHALVAMIIGSFLAVIAAVIVDSFLKGALRLSAVVDWGGFLNPFWWIPGIVLGLLVNQFLNRRTPRRAACWVWIAGALWLTAGIWDSVRYYDARYSQGCSVLQDVVNAFFILDSQRCRDGDSGLAGLFFTLPAMSAATYSVGAWFALRLRKRHQEQPRAGLHTEA